jgi:hypothetical protein
MTSNTMKTNLEWYKLLPDPYRMQAINNAERDDVLGMKISSLPASLFAFPWETTPEGHAYWQQVFDKAKAGEFDKQD